MADVTSGNSDTIKNHAAFIWSVADLLRGDYKQSEYGKVVLPLTVLRRFDCVLAPVKQDMLETYEKVKGKVDNFAPILDALTAVDGLWNTSRFDIPKLLDDPDNIRHNIQDYVAGFSPEAREILDRFEFASQITRLHKAGLLYLVLGKFAEIDLHPDRVSNLEMGYLYEELIRRFSELSNETAGEHFTPREVIRLMVNLLFIEDDAVLSKAGAKATLYDPACGTGGMLSVAEDFVRSHNPQATLTVYGQELNSESYAICRSDMMLKGQNASNIKVGNSLKAYDPEDPGDQGDQHPNERFDYLLANPPFGVEWKKVADSVRHEHESKGFAGRYGAGLPRINDGSFLFLQHMISKMKTPEQGGSRLAIVFNGSPLFTGAAGSGESEIRRWIIEHDWLEAVVALPDQLFYNTGISTYFWIVTNRKSSNRKGKVQLIDARQSFTKMRKSLGEKRKEVSEQQIADIVRLYGNFDQQLNDEDDKRVKIFDNETFGFLRITVERPLRLKWEVTDASADALLADKKLAKLDEQQLKDLVEHARGRVAAGTGTSFGSEAEARKEAKRWMAELGLEGKPIENAIVDALSHRDPDADPITDKHGKPEPDADLRDNENVPLPSEQVRYEPDPTDRLATDTYTKAVEQYVEQEVHPYVPDAWVDHTRTKIGYEVPLTRHFYVYTPPRPLEEIDAEIKQLEKEIQELLREVTE
ncbi:MAG: restriction endonuclease subunit M [Acidimicrobiaceae bacterium]|nr:restriction endonuclease subunit M [Acidimicrobiaceae bacterium]